MHIYRTRVVITSSRDPSIRVRNFLNTLQFVLPDSIKINRGKKNLRELFNIAVSLGALYVVLVLAKKGNPYKMLVYDLQSFSTKYIFRLAGLSLPLDYRITLNKIRNVGNIKSVCIRNNNCIFLRDFLIDMNLFTTFSNKCQIYVNLEEISNKECELLFILATENVKFLRVVMEAEKTNANTNFNPYR
ncbi:ribosomal biogenesis protein [Sulfolobus tengchongensis]|uniref:Ribosomal biogenesis protein n=1 Tax=Sulfolobus tengchongensis TaxID=207809 RepID=A0AAX4L049_9CREN